MIFGRNLPHILRVYIEDYSPPVSISDDRYVIDPIRRWLLPTLFPNLLSSYGNRSLLLTSSFLELFESLHIAVFSVSFS